MGPGQLDLHNKNIDRFDKGPLIYLIKFNYISFK